MSFYEIYNHKLLEFITANRCNLSNANLDILEENLFGFTNLEVLDASENRLRVLSSDIEKLKKLKVLILSDNPLESLPESIGELSMLESFFTFRDQTLFSAEYYHFAHKSQMAEFIR